MRRITVVHIAIGVLLVQAGSPGTALSQSENESSAEERRAAYEAHHGDFDYLLGDWEFDAESAEYGRFHGLWSAVRLAGGQILDEYRVVGDSGETFYVTTTIRNYNAGTDRWELIGMERGNGLQDIGTARRIGDEMHIEQRFGTSLWRIRYHDISQDGFSWSSDVSLDGGSTWQQGFMRLQARRRGPARHLPQLTPVPVSAGR